MIGSSSTGLALAKPCLKAIDEASLNAISEESTSWYEPNTSFTLTSTTGKPASGPLVMVSRRPFSTDGMNSFGITPPVMSLMNRKSSLISGAILASARSSAVIGDSSITT
ncbi:hypothetical protein G6F65_021653 [Rhizopus arrhizus]|nr:hypothetical protein G6F65_021653 [Rhizopus arrhizus]